MASIKCKACNKLYHYRNSELCPKCGAYNRPPRRMRVGFDKNGGVVLNSKTTSAEKVCYEEQPRKVRSDTLIDSKTLDALGDQLNKWGSRVEKWWAEHNEKATAHARFANDSPFRDRKKEEGGAGRAVAIAVAASMLASLIGATVDSCGSNLVEVRPEPDYSIPTEQVAPLEPYWTEEERKETLEPYGVTEVVNMGTVFDWNGVNVWVSGFEISGEMRDTFMVLGINSNDELPVSALTQCYLVWAPTTNMSWTYYPESYQNGALIFSGLEEPLYEETMVWLLCENYEENAETGELVHIGTTAVSLLD